MNSYWTAKVVLHVEDESTGKIKKKTEPYLVDAVSATDAEAKVYQDFDGYSGDFEVTSIVKSNIIKVLD